MTGSNILTAYFRTHFGYFGKTNATLVELSGKFDDGAVVYLNNTELIRFGLPSAPTAITNGSATTRSVSDTEGRDNAVFLAPTSLRQGDNLIAVQLVQVNLASGDLTMGLELTTFTPEPAPIVDCFSTLRSSIDGNDLTLTWNCGGRLQKSTDISSSDNWVTIPGAASPFRTNKTTAIRQFFRVIAP